MYYKLNWVLSDDRNAYNSKFNSAIRSGVAKSRKVVGQPRVLDNQNTVSMYRRIGSYFLIIVICHSPYNVVSNSTIFGGFLWFNCIVNVFYLYHALVRFQSTHHGHVQLVGWYHRLDGTLWLAASCKCRYRQRAILSCKFYRSCDQGFTKCYLQDSAVSGSVIGSEDC